jgi:hypothetical protein
MSEETQYAASETEDRDKRDTRGRFAPGNKIAKKTGAIEFERRGPDVLPPALREEYDAFVAQLTADQGGDEELTALRKAHVRRASECNTIASLIMADIVTRGRTRQNIDMYLKAVDKFVRLSKALGLARRQKPVKQRTIDDLEFEDDVLLQDAQQEDGDAEA